MPEEGGGAIPPSGYMGTLLKGSGGPGAGSAASGFRVPAGRGESRLSAAGDLAGRVQEQLHSRFHPGFRLDPAVDAAGGRRHGRIPIREDQE